MPLFPRRRGNRRVVEVLSRIREQRDDVVVGTRAALRTTVSESTLPEEVKAFIDPMVDDDRLVGFVFTKFAADLPSKDADDLIDNPERGKILGQIIAFIERGGLQMILEFILALVSALSK